MPQLKYPTEITQREQAYTILLAQLTERIAIQNVPREEQEKAMREAMTQAQVDETVDLVISKFLVQYHKF